MKIPEASGNVGAYYGTDENGQWQPNGVVIDNGVGGGVVGSGDAGIHRPVYPIHPRPHMPPAGYVVAGGYYAAGFPPPPQDDFADYMWMENEEEFDKQVLQQLEEEALMEQCIEAMLEDEQRERRAHTHTHTHTHAHAHTHPHNYPTTSNGTSSLSLEEAVSRSTLNPLAAEFVPTGVRGASGTGANGTGAGGNSGSTETPSVATEESTEAISEAPPEESTDTHTTHTDDANKEEPVSPPKDPPEVSAADVTPITKKDTKKVETLTKKPAPSKTDVKKKPLPVKSETKMAPKKKELKPAKSEAVLDEDITSDVTKPQSTPTEELKDLQLTENLKESSPSGPKPINYAAAAKSTKTKPKSTTPPLETTKMKPKSTTPPLEATKTALKEAKPKAEKIEKKPLPKEKVQRKNSTK